jgi:limonene-1,2-epoxide hydrolase
VPSPDEQLQQAIAAIDAANAEDPNSVTVRGRTGPKEVVHAELVTEWVARMRPDAGPALLLAARGHHFRRWRSPRATYPAGRAGYLRWRKALQAEEARDLGSLLETIGYDAETIGHVQRLVRKEGLGRDDEVQVLEDALCLVFLETQLDDVAARLEPDTLERVVVRTAHKMSPTGLALAAEVPLSASGKRLLDEALARDIVRAYLFALAAHDWPALAATLAPGVHRIGPYGDVFDGRDAYAGFLATTLAALSGYELDVHRTIVNGSTVAVELAETVDDVGGRLRTEEVVVFDVVNGLIERVAVYLQQSAIE